jgi:hypothetical protein
VALKLPRVRRTIVGPTAHPELARVAVTHALEEFGGGLDPVVRVSKIPYRG